MTYPDDSVQSIVAEGDWWKETGEKQLSRGSLNYGVDQDGTRAGYNPPLVERIRHAEYGQFFWDKLPTTDGPKESILRFDHLQPIGTNCNSYELTGYRLSDKAMGLIDDWLTWLIWGGVPVDSEIILYRELIADVFGG